MIDKLRIRGYRKFEDLTFKPGGGMNILVGDNESGKSTMVEAINLAMTGHINGRPDTQGIAAMNAARGDFGDGLRLITAGSAFHASSSASNERH